MKFEHKTVTGNKIRQQRCGSFVVLNIDTALQYKKAWHVKRDHDRRLFPVPTKPLRTIYL